MVLVDDTKEELILVDEADRALAPAGKLQAHRDGALHRAFSIFVFRPNGDIVLQKRAAVKYHSAGKWANTCCGHPRPGERVADAAARRLAEETGLSCPLTPGFQARYTAELDNGLVENELVHVFFGVTSDPGAANPSEVECFRELDLAGLDREIRARPGDYAVWLVTYFARHKADIVAARNRLLGGTENAP